MENASKALIIAGAILLSIIIISLGLVVVNNVRDSIEGQNLNKEELAAFNDQFLSYENTNVSGAKVNSLIQTVISSNQAQIDNAKGNYVTCTFPQMGAAAGAAAVSVTVTDDVAVIPSPARVVPGKTYTVVIGYGANSAVNQITITAN